MRYPGQVQTAIELLEELQGLSTPADRYMSLFFKKRRYIGSSDKGVVADITYTVYRRQGELRYILEQLGLSADMPYNLVLVALYHCFGKTIEEIAAVYEGSEYSPEALSKHEMDLLKKVSKVNMKDAPAPARANFPEWLEPSLIKSFGDNLVAEMRALGDRATTDIRVNTLKASLNGVQKELKLGGFDMQRTEISPWGLRMASRRSLFNSEAFKKGWFEIQDEGSQLITLASGVASGMTVVDFCAGAGGKTLGLSAMMENKGTVYACDTNQRRLDELPKRVKRSGAGNIRRQHLQTEHTKWVKRHKNMADVVLIDAPCTGTGTWRRSPDSKWRINEESLNNLLKTQQDIMQSAQRMVKVGGRLVYATCSVLQEENQEQIEKFLNTQEGFEVQSVSKFAPEIKPFETEEGFACLSPLKSGTDGFFIAILKRTA